MTLGTMSLGLSTSAANTFHDRLGCADEDVGTDHLIMR
jgi:hypothetical protein